jgi:hypothetical protein
VGFNFAVRGRHTRQLHVHSGVLANTAVQASLLLSRQHVSLLFGQDRVQGFAINTMCIAYPTYYELHWFYIAPSYNTFFCAIYGKYFNFYLTVLFTGISTYMEVMATLDFYLVITQRLPALHTKRAFLIITPCIIVFFSLFLSFNWFGLEIRLIPANQTTILLGNAGLVNRTHDYQEFYYTYLDFGRTLGFKILHTMDISFREIVCFLVLIVLNSLIVVEMKRVTERKIKMHSSATQPQQKSIAHPTDATNTNTQNTNTNHANLASKAERKRAHMIVLTGVLYSFGNMGYLVFWINTSITQKPLADQPEFWSWWAITAFTLWYVNASIPFWFYYLFNSVFHELTNKNL